MKTNHNITHKQMFFLVLQTQIGIGVLSLPYNIYLVSGTDGWISVIIAGVFAQLFTILFWVLVKKYPDKSLFDINKLLLGKILGNLINLGYVLFYIFVSSLIAVLYVNVLKRWIYHETPAWVLILLLAAVAVYFAKENIRKMARFFVIVSFLLIFLFLLTLNAYQTADIRYIFPIGDNGMLKILLGSKEAIMSFLGFEIMLFLYPYINSQPNQVLKSVTVSNIIVTIFYSYIAFTSYVFFSPKEMKIVPEPTLYLLKAITYSVIERVDLVFLAIWVVSVITSGLMYIYIASTGMQNVFNKKNHRSFVPLIVLAVSLLALSPAESDQLAGKLGDYVDKLSYIFVFAIPVCLLIVSFFRKGKKKHDQTY
ncbi:GerAB/ArcD/ProY family transporter [Metabacillus idriensis]|uniref:GerAB/ArcD/ProY family transporter n=1 Tax=Metabacillus idriensis TaxID=324768 RepID=UPI003D2AC1E3